MFLLFALLLAVAPPPKGQVDFVDASGVEGSLGPCQRVSSRYDTGNGVVYLRVDCSRIFHSSFED